MKKEDKLKYITAILQVAIPSLMSIENGQVFHSEFYGNIVATKVEPLSGGKYSIYGFDEATGMPRSDYYPRDLKLVGKDIMLNHVLYYVVNELNVDATPLIAQWGLLNPCLKDQSEEVVSYVFDLISPKP
jgi:hypothetical protein